MKHRRRGFSLIEMLVVIGVILILVAMAVIGFNHLAHSAAGRSTNVTLANLRGMLSEYAAMTGGIDNLGAPYPGGVYSPGAGNGSLGYDSTNTNSATLIGITDVGTDGPDRKDYTETATPNKVLANTWYVMAALMKVPAVRDAVLKLPPKQILRNASGNPWLPAASASAGQGAVLLDGWGNPIIFVPSGGINVWLAGQSTTTPFRVQSPDKQPFFASAGQDGDFGADSAPVASPRQPAGDDNVYSFENKQ